MYFSNSHLSDCHHQPRVQLDLVRVSSNFTAYIGSKTKTKKHWSFSQQSKP
jgi:hypothetical protein